MLKFKIVILSCTLWNTFVILTRLGFYTILGLAEVER